MDLERGFREYYIVENRWPGNFYDSQLPDQGIAVWHIMEESDTYDAALPPPNVSSADWAPVGGWSRKGIRIIRPIVTPPFNDGQAVWSQGDPGFDLVSDDLDPAHGELKWGDGTPSGFALRQISPASAQMDLLIEVPNSPPGAPPRHRLCRVPYRLTEAGLLKTAVSAVSSSGYRTTV
jgi:hypothetical protein